jgi:hypothetical protein
MKSKKISDNELTNLLQGLPKEKAPENFEFNLMTRIQNKQFGNLQKEEKSIFWWIMLPSGTIVLSAFILFAVLFNNSKQTSNLVNKTKSFQGKPDIIYVVLPEENQISEKKSISNDIFVKIAKSNVSSPKINQALPYNSNNNVLLDGYLDKPIPNSFDATLVSGGSSEQSVGNFATKQSIKVQNDKAKKDSIEAKKNLKTK